MGILAFRRGRDDRWRISVGPKSGLPDARMATIDTSASYKTKHLQGKDWFNHRLMSGSLSL